MHMEGRKERKEAFEKGRTDQLIGVPDDKLNLDHSCMRCDTRDPALLPTTLAMIIRHASSSNTDAGAFLRWLFWRIRFLYFW